MASTSPAVTKPAPLPAAQAEVIAFLSDPSTYACGEPVDRFETHANLVFLAGTDAWKIKRAVRFPYLDFSTLDRRREACRREVEVNRRFTPELYVDCVPITCRSDGGFEIDGPGEVVEWCVHMRRFDQAALLSNIANTDGITPDLARSVADTVFESHAHADPIESAVPRALFGRVVSSLCQSLSRSEVFEAELVQAFSASVARQHTLAQTTLEERARQGCVRRCHGDLHLANIVLWQGRPALYDAIEFDETIASTDTLYDLAFLLMDLDWHGQRRAATAVLNRYMWRSNRDLDLTGLRALPLFLGVRAGVRALVSADRAAQQQAVASLSDVARARGYLQAALGYLNPPAPRLIAVGGLSGTGKTTLAAALAPGTGPAPGAMHFRSDLERKALFGAEETARLGGQSYSPQVSQQVYATLRRKARLTLDAGHSVIVDAVHARPEERFGVERIAAEFGLPFRGLWLEAEPQRLLERVTGRRNDASDATAGVVRQQLALDFGALSPAWTVLDANGSAAEILERAAMMLADTDRRLVEAPMGG
jgi:aminoglycoside phosphotransferase family enzyme/predicted kinase